MCELKGGIKSTPQVLWNGQLCNEKTAWQMSAPEPAVDVSSFEMEWVKG